MLTLEHVETAGWRPALRGMRNPLDSWKKADSVFTHDNPWPFLGENDESLMRRLIGQGSSDHCKFRRMIAVYCDVTAPLYWWKEFDTYKVGTVANSCSTMHTIMSEPFMLEMFSWEDVICGYETLPAMLHELNLLRSGYIRQKENGNDELAQKCWRSLIQELPSSWNQRRTLMLNYEVLSNIYRARRHHKLREWRDFIDAMVENLPYPWIFTGEGC